MLDVILNKNNKNTVPKAPELSLLWKHVLICLPINKFNVSPLGRFSTSEDVYAFATAKIIKTFSSKKNE